MLRVKPGVQMHGGWAAVSKRGASSLVGWVLLALTRGTVDLHIGDLSLR